MDPWTLTTTVAVVVATAAFGGVVGRALVRTALASGGLGVAAAGAMVAGSLALGGVLSPVVGGMATALSDPLVGGLGDVPRYRGAVVAVAGAGGPALAWALWVGVRRAARALAGAAQGPGRVGDHAEPLPAPGLVCALAAATGAMLTLGATPPWASVLGRLLLGSVGGSAAAAVAAAALMTVLAWALRHSTPEPVHRRSRALTPLTLVLIGAGAGLQAVAVGRLLLLLAAPRPARAAGALVPGAGWPDVLLAASLATGAVAWLALGLRREGPVRRCDPLQAAVGQLAASGALLAGAALGWVVPVRLAVTAGDSGAGAATGARALSVTLLRHAWSGTALVPAAALVGAALGAVVARLG